MWNISNQHATEVVENICPHCGEHLLMNKRAFANHVRWCKKNPKYEEIRKSTVEKVKKALEDKITSEKGEIKKFKVTCAKCGREFEVEEREKDFPSKEKYYCSRACANSHERTEESRRKTSQSLQKYARAQGMKIAQDTFQEDKICPICGKVFHTIHVNQIACSLKCAHKLKALNIAKEKFGKITDDIEKGKFLYSLYRHQCNFKFALNQFPTEFDFSLIKENGWYKAKNHGDNLYGVSRDHIFSVNEAFKQQIDPYYISHPANCKLLLHSDNVSKSDECGITFEELKDKVQKWNEKYGVYENKINYNILKEIKLTIEA
jgi:predicted RNA-binding Zn-ribbon protein involved in translation (DUF1610 family)